VPSAVVCGQASRTWRRQVGALAWVALEELALRARPDDQGWVTPVGVRAIATGIGTTPAAALGAVADLGRAGLVSLEPVTDQYGHRRFGFRLYPPPGFELRCRPLNAQPTGHDQRPPFQDNDRFRPDDDKLEAIEGQWRGHDTQGSGGPTETLPHRRPSARRKEQP
jgi:hypothetical protein